MMKKFHFSIRTYIKNSRLDPLILPSDKSSLYTCYWYDDGSCRFEGVEDGFSDLKQVLEKYFDFEGDEAAGIEFTCGDGELIGITDQCCFERVLQKSAQRHSLFTILITVNAPLNPEYSQVSAQGVNFDKVWDIAKPKFRCIREWLLNASTGAKIDHVPYCDRAYLFNQLGGSKVQAATNQKIPNSGLDQSRENLTFSPDKSVAASDSTAVKTDMLQEKMILDPVISMVLFNEYIPLKQPSKTRRPHNEAEALTGKMEGLFLGQTKEETGKVSDASQKGIFLRSEPSSRKSEGSSPNGQGLFLRSGSVAGKAQASAEDDDWVIA